MWIAAFAKRGCSVEPIFYALGTYINFLHLSFNQYGVGYLLANALRWK